MKIFVIIDHDRWGHSTNIVRADTREAAVAMVCPHSSASLVEIVELADTPGILWCDDVSPDTPR